MIKRLIAVSLAALMMLVLLPISVLAATSGDYEYTDNGDGTCTITRYIGSDTDFTIPSALDGLSVTKIGDNAFYDKGLTNIIIPNSVSAIGAYALRENDLASITIPDSVTFISEYAFADNLLTNISIPDSVKDICEGAFFSCDLTSIALGSNLEFIGPKVFMNNKLTNTALNSTTIPGSVTYIGANAFSGNTADRLILPTGTGEWTDGNDNAFQGGDTVTDFSTEYFTEPYAPIVISANTSYTRISDNKFEINYTLREPLIVSIRIKLLPARTVMDFKKEAIEGSGNYTVNWNGKSKYGLEYPSGEFFIEAVVRKDCNTKTVKKYIWYVNASEKTVVDQVKDGRLHRKLENPDGLINRIVIYYGMDDDSAINKINYYEENVRSSYRIFNTSSRIKNFVQLYSDGKVRKVNYYNEETGNRKSYKLYDTAGRITHLIYCHGGGSPRKVNYYNVNTGIRTMYKIYDHSGDMTHFATCYSDGVKVKKVNYYGYDDIRWAYKTFRTDGTCSCYVKCDNKGHPAVATYFDKNGKVIKVVHY